MAKIILVGTTSGKGIVRKKPLVPSGMALGDTFTFGKYQVESEDPWAIEWGKCSSNG